MIHRSHLLKERQTIKETAKRDTIFHQILDNLEIILRNPKANVSLLEVVNSPYKVPYLINFTDQIQKPPQRKTYLAISTNKSISWPMTTQKRCVVSMIWLIETVRTK